MNYFVIAVDGQKYGPAGIDVLNQWIREGRLYPTTMLEPEAGGPQVPASSIPGLSFPMSQPMAGHSEQSAQGKAQPGPSYTNQGPSGFANPQQAPYAGYQRYGNVDTGSSDITMAWIFGAMGLLCCPIIFSVMGIIFANKAIQKGQASGQAALIFSVVTLVVGILIGIGSFLTRLGSLR